MVVRLWQLPRFLQSEVTFHQKIQLILSVSEFSFENTCCLGSHIARFNNFFEHQTDEIDNNITNNFYL